MSNHKQEEMYADMENNPSKKALEELRRKPYQAAGQKPAYIKAMNITKQKGVKEK